MIVKRNQNLDLVHLNSKYAIFTRNFLHLLSTFCRIYWMCSGVIPQHPPTILTPNLFIHICTKSFQYFSSFDWKVVKMLILNSLVCYQIVQGRILFYFFRQIHNRGYDFGIHGTLRCERCIGSWELTRRWSETKMWGGTIHHPHPRQPRWPSRVENLVHHSSTNQDSTSWLSSEIENRENVRKTNRHKC